MHDEGGNLEHGAGESPFLGQAGGGSWTGAFWLAGGRTAVFPMAQNSELGTDLRARALQRPPPQLPPFPRRGEGGQGVWWRQVVALGAVEEVFSLSFPESSAQRALCTLTE